MQEASLDGRSVLTEGQCHDAIAAALRFPDWYGRNLNALWDCLCSLEEPTRLTWAHHRVSREALGERFDGIAKVLESRSRAELDGHGERYPAFEVCWG